MSIYSLDKMAGIRNAPFIIQRLRWIDDRLHWHGGLARSDLIRRFAVSPQQASADIAMYLDAAPENARLDATTKRYVRSDCYAPVFAKDAFQWMSESKDTSDPSVIPCESLTLPSRWVNDDALAAMITGFGSRRAVAISYQSLTTAEVTQRTICPHHVVDTGDRVHLRAWDSRRRLFTDFVLGRILSAEPDPSYPWVDSVADTSWSESVEIVLAPDGRLSRPQKAAVEREFHMQHGNATIQVRKALLVYVLERLGLLEAVRRGEQSPERSRGIACLNPDVLTPHLPLAASDDTELETPVDDVPDRVGFRQRKRR
jgi:hypothetical protein